MLCVLWFGSFMNQDHGGKMSCLLSSEISHLRSRWRSWSSGHKPESDSAVPSLHRGHLALSTDILCHSTKSREWCWQWEQARAASECSPMHRAAPKQRITWPAMLIALILKSPQVNSKQSTMIPRLPITSSFFSQELFQENLALKLIFCCYCNKWPWPTWLKWYRFHYLVPLKVRSLPSEGDDKESVACHSQLLQASHCFWFVALTS